MVSGEGEADTRTDDGARDSDLASAGPDEPDHSDPV